MSRKSAKKTPARPPLPGVMAFHKATPRSQTDPCQCQAAVWPKGRSARPGPPGSEPEARGAKKNTRPVTLVGNPCSFTMFGGKPDETGKGCHRASGWEYTLTYLWEVPRTDTIQNRAVVHARAELLGASVPGRGMRHPAASMEFRR